MKYAILIDAGFIKRKLGSHASPIDSTKVQAFLAALRTHAALAAMHLHRVYWYDAPPLNVRVDKPLAGGTVDFSATPLGRANTRLSADLCKLPFMAMRQGDCVFRGWKVKGQLPSDAESVSIVASDLVANIHQKGVDMRLGLDIAALTLKGHVGTIVLVAGDSDFVPAMKFARREGAQVFLVTFGHPVRREMYEHSDLLLEIPAEVSQSAVREPAVKYALRYVMGT